MIFADKLINLRKKAGMSQEDLAYKLGVSRQSVSKWEGAQSIPDINKIIEMSKLFGVTTDYLLKEDIEDLEFIEQTDEELVDVKKVTMEMTTKYLSVVDNTRFKIAFGAFLCIISPILLILLGALNEFSIVNEVTAAATGLVVLLVFVSIAVVFFVLSGLKLNEYEFLEKKAFETEYGVTGLVKEKKKSYQDTYNKLLISGITLCILSVLPIFILLFFENGKFVVFGVCALLLIVAIGVFVIISTGCKMGAYNKLLQEGNYVKENKKASSVVDIVTTVYWLIATAIYLLWSFLSNDWQITWVVWVIAGVLFPAVIMIAKAFKKNSN